MPFAVCSPLGVVRRVWEVFQVSGFEKIVSIHGFREHVLAAVDERLSERGGPRRPASRRLPRISSRR